MIDDIKKRALHRTKILQGQMRGLEKMIDADEYCVDIITQSLAIQKSLSSLNKLLVENHLRTHVTDMFDAGGDEREKAVAELIAVYELQNNRGS
ncbi:DNA-binding FrmR family transcriptional regulator [Microcella putealis]|uniref:DNA-binding FrmR family transcriptional regulator n=1 Tax=Microcella putealis TaxID=337005 RepID=A0A4Q7LXS0_9MICO|nr:metal-sensitive transcriptional regulator [Microcella putealis]RZS59491.1 DNA-binding FrmR family transcriptional regulator [Microcella putealis]TQM26604.1 DNA-binding FrmR family transcriptional regulator [Microcella putealis]